MLDPPLPVARTLWVWGHRLQAGGPGVEEGKWY